jgi:hypothetical protein
MRGSAALGQAEERELHRWHPMRHEVLREREREREESKAEG